MRTKGPGFTLLEMLTVVAIVGLLAALLFPGLAASRRSAGKARTKVQFAQWTAALESFRTEYGHYPQLDSSGLVNGGVTANDHLFHDILAARKRDGSALATGSPARVQNKRLISLHAFANNEITPAGLIGDAFGNTMIAVLLDRDLDGVIRRGTDFADLPLVAGLAPGPQDFPEIGIRAGVLFYCPAPGATVEKPEFIFSWK
jgi:prepilin-type N-terminal cleavage/methylation domain-containing protein